jgi:hypothetical protein
LVAGDFLSPASSGANRRRFVVRSIHGPRATIHEPRLMTFDMDLVQHGAQEAKK